jgi:hypothetical protein
MEAALSSSRPKKRMRVNGRAVKAEPEADEAEGGPSETTLDLAGVLVSAMRQRSLGRLAQVLFEGEPEALEALTVETIGEALVPFAGRCAAPWVALLGFGTA